MDNTKRKDSSHNITNNEIVIAQNLCNDTSNIGGNSSGLPQSIQKYTTMANVGLDQSSSNSEYYICHFNQNSNKNNNQQIVSNITHTQQQPPSYIDEQSLASSLANIKFNAVNIAANNQNIQQQLQKQSFVFADPTKDQQQHHHQHHRHHQHQLQLINNSNSNIDHNSMLQSFTSNQNVGNSVPMFDSSRNTNNNNANQMRISYPEQPQYIQNLVTTHHPSNLENMSNNIILQNYSNYPNSFQSALTLPSTGLGSSVYSRASPLTVLWLLENYESADGVSLPRCLLYAHYVFHCKNHEITPVNSASFGKLIRSLFPNLKTRRLGTRGKSKYHYYGIRIRDNSQLHTYGRNEEEVMNYLNAENEVYLQKVREERGATGNNGENGNLSVSSTAESTPKTSSRLQENKTNKSEHTLKRKYNHSTNNDTPSVINIALQDSCNFTSMIPNENDLEQSNKNLANDNFSFNIFNFSEFFPDETIFPFGVVVTQDYPTLKSYHIDLDLANMGELGSMLSSFETDKNIFIRIHSVEQLKYILKYTTSKLLKHVPRLDSTIFLNQLKENLTNLHAIIESNNSIESNNINQIFECEEIINLVTELDILTYQYIVHRVIPKLFSIYPASYNTILRLFSRKIRKIMLEYLSPFPSAFIKTKLKNVESFIQVIWHYTSINHLYNGAINSITQIKQKKLAKELTRIDVCHAVQQYDLLLTSCNDWNILETSTKELISILESNLVENVSSIQLEEKSNSSYDKNHSDSEHPNSRHNQTTEKNREISLEKYNYSKSKLIKEIFNWAQNILKQFFRHHYGENYTSTITHDRYISIFRKFLNMWNQIILIVVKELTLYGSGVFGLVHIFHMLLFEYYNHLMECDMFEIYNILPISMYTKNKDKRTHRNL